MKKVKVQRYMAGKIPDFARDSDSENEQEDDKSIFISRDDEHGKHEDSSNEESDEEEALRIRRKKETRLRRRREEEELLAKQEELEEGEHDAELEEQEAYEKRKHSRHKTLHIPKNEIKLERDEPAKIEFEEEEMDEEEMQRRRELIRLKRRREEEKELLTKQREVEDVSEEESEEETSEEEEESEDEVAPRLKPVFVPKNDRVTIIELEKEQEKLEQLRMEEEKRKEEKKRQTAKMVEEQLKREADMEKAKREENGGQLDWTAVNTDDESEEIAYELWKVREMKRLKRNRDEREALDREKEEMDRIHGMTEDERREYMRLHPKIITNEQKKGKYKFLQKYYHRGVFFLDKDDDVLKRNFAEATGEDVFDKSVLPRVMQVKNFGKASRSKWTHLTAEDTTDHQGVWATPTPLSMKFVTKHSGGMKSVFERPATKKRKVTTD